jgi:hypothetical protein
MQWQHLLAIQYAARRGNLTPYTKALASRGSKHNITSLLKGGFSSVEPFNSFEAPALSVKPVSVVDEFDRCTNMAPRRLAGLRLPAVVTVNYGGF